VLLRIAKTSAVEPHFTSDKIHHSQDLDPPSLLYGSEKWVLTKREENQLLVFVRKVFRTICGLKIENGVYWRRCNQELEKEFHSPNALNATKTSRLRYAGHMIRRPEDLPKKALFGAKPINGIKEKSRKTEIQVDGWGEQR
jgi:hypothetical protein